MSRTHCGLFAQWAKSMFASNIYIFTYYICDFIFGQTASPLFAHFFRKTHIVIILSGMFCSLHGCCVPAFLFFFCSNSQSNNYKISVVYFLSILTDQKLCLLIVSHIAFKNSHVTICPQKYLLCFFSVTILC